MRVATATLALLVLGASPAAAQWTVTWGGAVPACEPTPGAQQACFSAQLNYAADGSATLLFWNRSNTQGNDRGIVDGIGFENFAAPVNTAFTLTEPDGSNNTAWSYNTPPFGNVGNWGWQRAGGGICDVTSLPANCGGGQDKFNTDWRGSFGAGGAAVFEFFLAPNLDKPDEAVWLSLHTRDAYYDEQEEGWTSFKSRCTDNRYVDCTDRPDIPFETVPEPATMTLLATGLAGMAAARRRRRDA